MYKLGLEKAEEPEVKLPTFTGSYEKQGNSRKTTVSAQLTTLKHLTVWITANCGKFLKRWEYLNTLPIFWENLYRSQETTVGTWHGTTDWFKIGKGVWQGCVLLLIYLTYMQSTSCEMPGWMNPSWNQDCSKKYQQPQIWRWCHCVAESEEELKSLLIKVKEESEKLA